MRLPDAGLGRRHPGLADGAPDALLLGRAAGRREARAPAVLVHAAAHDRGQRPVGGVRDVVVVLRSQVGGAASLAPDEAVGAGVEGEAAAPEGEHRGRALADPAGGVDHAENAHAHGVVDVVVGRLVGQRQLVLPPVREVPHHVRGRVRRHQRGGAGRIHGDVGACEVHAVRQPRDGDPVEVAARHVPVLSPVDLVPLAAGVPHEGADALARQGLLAPAALEERLVADLQDPALRGGHGLRLLLAYAEEPVVEVLDAVDVTLVLGVGPAADLRGLHVVGQAVDVEVPAHHRDLDEGVAAGLVDHEPVAEEVLGVAAEADAHAADGHGLARGRLGPGLQAAQGLEVAAHVAELELGPRAEQPALAEQGPALGPPVREPEALRHEQDQEPGRGLELQLLALAREQDPAAQGAQALEHQHTPAPDEAQEALALGGRGLAGRREVSLLVLIAEGLAQQQVRAALDPDPEVLLERLRQRAAKPLEERVLLRKGRGPEVRALCGVEVHEHVPLPAVAAEEVRLEVGVRPGVGQALRGLLHLGQGRGREQAPDRAVALGGELRGHLAGRGRLVGAGA
mmetsp:Transcript_56898/g.161514  ORF Transcript_56898/g.161514 Transcript_56898/m.161514 type:complete len:570 (+) Transcript_56898:1167-2876(+)